MAKRLVLKGQTRTETGSKQAKRLRDQGLVPAIAYGHKEEPISIKLNCHDLTEALHHGHRLMDIEVDGKLETVIVKDLQYDHLGKGIIHADLMRVDASEKVNVTVAIEAKGTAKGTLEEGGMLQIVADTIDINCPAEDIPEVIYYNVEDLEIGDAFHANELPLPEGAELVSEPETTLASCIMTRVEEEEEEEEMVPGEIPTEPEVITERPAEEETEEG
ncbi:General stress protein CTC [Anaerohalosphaera lusitana]|uniref:Large ribosomal subunit protein bL25 n=1 Tax=Anaerohalosphaera lusitana TaxID=1936003 RepID=A0A1U9NIJ7_9BACT|nr:50S ribosomal protein L25 [Anaerohalosphaera lusitana]AQT67326.1 General stress protein CTC [Anaerohalosphaera lusitana]